jgi:hypothetical protein
MTAEPSANRFRAAVLSGRGGQHDDLVVRTKNGRVDIAAEGLAAVPVPRCEERRSNQRGGDRHRLTAEQVIVRYKRRANVVELINLSAGGAMVRGKLDAMLWDHVALVLGGQDQIECAIVWIKGDDLGLEFAHETRIDCDQETRDELLRAVILKSFPDLKGDPLTYPKRRAEDDPDADPGAAQRRITERHPLIWSGIVYYDYQVEPVRLRNVSAGGALVQSSHDLLEGETVYLDLREAGKHEAKVCWTRGGQSGLAFTEPFDLQLLSKCAPEVASDSPTASFGNEQAKAWAPGWRRSTIDEMARSLGG